MSDYPKMIAVDVSWLQDVGRLPVGYTNANAASLPAPRRCLRVKEPYQDLPIHLIPVWGSLSSVEESPSTVRVIVPDAPTEAVLTSPRG
jgi:hypothetical protein